MKAILRKLLPAPVRSGLRKTYENTLGRRRLPPGVYESLPALKCQVAYNRLGAYCVPESSRDRQAARRILSGDVYEPDVIEFITGQCGDGDIVHAGTYFGDFLPALSHAVAPGARVWAFEPNPENFRCASITCLLNGLDNVMLDNVGLGASPDTMKVRTRDEHGRSLGGGSEIVSANTNDSSDGLEEVSIVTVDQTVPADRNVSVIQLDVEGFEQQALTGALETIRRCRPIIILEVLPGTSLLQGEWFAETILSLGYRHLDSMHGNDILVNENRG